jgi:putative tryptophan/tyrosine transport system substrate-binding protein
MKRREFIALLGGAAAAWPYAAHAQLPAMPVIGFFSPNAASAAGPWTAAFVQRLHELDRIEGRTMTIAYRWGEGRNDRAAEVVAEFVRLKVDVIVTHGEPNISAAKQGDVGHPDRLCIGDRSDRQRLCCKFVKTRWQCHRLVNPVT